MTQETLNLGGFGGASAPRIGDQVRLIFGDGTRYLGLADIHSALHTHRFAAHPEVMQAFADSHVGIIDFEALDHDEALMLQAFQENPAQMPRAAVIAYLDYLHPFDVAYGRRSNLDYNTMAEIEALIVDAAAEAAKHGIVIQDIDHGEGFIPADHRDFLLHAQETYAHFVLGKIESTEGFTDAGFGYRRFWRAAADAFKAGHPDIMEKFEELYTVLQEQTQDNAEAAVRDLLTRLEIVEGQPVPGEKYPELRAEMVDVLGYGLPEGVEHPVLQDTAHLPDREAADILFPHYIRVKMNFITYGERVALDPEVAQRMGQTGEQSGEGVRRVSLYGAFHWLRLEGDIDAALGEDQTKVLRVYGDKARESTLEESLMLRHRRFMGLDTDDPYDITLDLSTGNWTAREGGTVVVEVPDDLRPQSLQGQGQPVVPRFDTDVQP